jgi:kynureninase
VIASLSIFNETSLDELRERSVRLTGYLERLLNKWPMSANLKESYWILTPRDPQQRGAQLSIRLSEGLLEPVMEILEREGVVVDERRPDVVRVAPAPLYNSFEDVWRFMVAFEKALKVATSASTKSGTGGIMVEGPGEKSGWSEVT